MLSSFASATMSTFLAQEVMFPENSKFLIFLTIFPKNLNFLVRFYPKSEFLGSIEIGLHESRFHKRISPNNFH